MIYILPHEPNDILWPTGVRSLLMPDPVIDDPPMSAPQEICNIPPIDAYCNSLKKPILGMIVYEETYEYNGEEILSIMYVDAVVKQRWTWNGTVESSLYTTTTDRVNFPLSGLNTLEPFAGAWALWRRFSMTTPSTVTLRGVAWQWAVDDMVGTIYGQPAEYVSRGEGCQPCYVGGVPVSPGHDYQEHPNLIYGTQAVDNYKYGSLLFRRAVVSGGVLGLTGKRRVGISGMSGRARGSAGATVGTEVGLTGNVVGNWVYNNI